MTGKPLPTTTDFLINITPVFLFSPHLRRPTPNYSSASFNIRLKVIPLRRSFLHFLDCWPLTVFQSVGRWTPVSSERANFFSFRNQTVWQGGKGGLGSLHQNKEAIKPFIRSKDSKYCALGTIWRLKKYLIQSNKLIPIGIYFILILWGTRNLSN